MPEGRGSSFREPASRLEVTDSSTSPPRNRIDEAPTEIKRQDQLLPGVQRAAESATVGETAAGVRFDHFELIDCIGVGGMGRVFRARDSRLDRLVALKVLSPDLSKDREICRRFEQEAKAAARLDDPHFARVYYYGEAHGLAYIAMEFVEGENLRKKILARGRLDVGDVVNIGLQIVHGLAHAATAGVIHRDIKPSNIIVTPAGVAKLVDMGLARSFFQGSSAATELTQAGVTLGTFDYISPEQARDPREADVRSDIYSLGCTLYHALTGRPPFPDGTPLQKLLQHQSDPAPDPRRLAPDLPDELVAILMRMLAKDPADRYQRPADLIHDLVALSEWLGIPLPDEGFASEGFIETPSFWERQATWLAPTALLAIVVGAYLYFDRSEEIALPTVEPARVETAGPVAAPTGRAATNSAVEAPVAIPIPAVAQVRRVPERADLRKAIDEANPGDTLELVGESYEVRPTLDRRSGKPAGLVIDKRLTLRSANQNLVRLEIDDERVDTDPTAPLALVTVRDTAVNLSRLVLTVRCSPDAPRGVTTVLVAGGEATMADCYFKLLGGPRKSPCAMIELTRSGDGAIPRVVAERCYFGGGLGQDAVRLDAGVNADVRLSDCAFEQYKRPFVLAGRSKLDLKNISLFVGDGAVFHVLARGVDHQVVVTDSVFSRLRTAAPQALVAVSGDSRGSEAWWRGERNLYHGFEKSLIAVDDRIVASRADELERWGLDERGPLFFAQSDWPWALDDPKNVSSSDQAELVRQNPVSVYRLASATGLLTRGADSQPLGVRRGPWGRIYPADQTARVPPVAAERSLSPPAPKDQQSAKAKVTTAKPPNAVAESLPTVLVVDPKVPAGTRQGVLRGLPSACDEAASGSTIELRSDDAIEIRDIKIAAKELTIRAASGTRPRLTLSRTTMNRGEPARLFSLSGGAKLRLVGLAIDLDDATGAEGAPLGVELDESSGIEFRQCAIVVGQPSAIGLGPTLINVRSASLRPNGMSGMPVGAAGARIEMSRCDVRARGRVLGAEPRGFWRLAITESFLALDGPIIDVRGDVGVVASSEPNRVELRSATIFARDTLISVDAGPARNESPRRLEVVAEETAILGVTAPLTRVPFSANGELGPELIRWDGRDNLLAGYRVAMQRTGGPDAPLAVSQTPADWLRQARLGDQNFVLGPTDIAELSSASIWDASIPTISSFRRFGWPGDRGESLGAPPAMLPERLTRANSL